VLLNHIDVVPAENTAKNIHPPFSGVITEGMVWGRGAIDNKGMAVMQLLGMEPFIEISRNTDLPFNITMLSVSGEETGGHNGAGLISDHFVEYLNPVAVYGEGGVGMTGIISKDPRMEVFGIAVSNKHSLWLELYHSIPTSGHGAVTPPNYVIKDFSGILNNIVNFKRHVSFNEATREMFFEMGKLEGRFKGMALKNLWLFRPLVIKGIKREDLVFCMCSNAISVSSINTPPGPPNQLPQEISFVLDCRLLPHYPTDRFMKKLSKAINNPGIQLRVIMENQRAEISPREKYYHFMKEALTAVYQGSSVVPIISPASDDNNYFRKHGIPTYGILPVVLDAELLMSIHNINERLPVDALEQGIRVYTELIRVIQGAYNAPLLTSRGPGD
jgi:carboxypeptidase PM20D1